MGENDPVAALLERFGIENEDPDWEDEDEDLDLDWEYEEGD